MKKPKFIPPYISLKTWYDVSRQKEHGEASDAAYRKLIAVFGNWKETKRHLISIGIIKEE